MILRLLVAGILLALGALLMAFGVMTALYGDPLATTLVILIVALLFVSSAVWAWRRGR
jgi:heme A synthase